MKNLIYYTFNLLFLGLFFISCEEESLVISFGNSEGTTLTLKLSSRATVTGQDPVSGEDSYNENVIKSISCFLYPYDTSLTETDKTKMVAKHNVNVSDDNTLGEQTVTITLNNDEKELLFPNGTDGDQCDIYVIANFTTSVKDNVVNLKNTAITASFDEKDIQTSFVMDGDVEKVILNGNKIATPDNNPYNLQRAASKIKLSVTKILNQVEDAAGNTWVPAYVEEKTTDENGNVATEIYLPMYLRFFNGVKDATVDVGTGRPTNTAITDKSYFSIKKTGNQGSDRNMMALVGSANNNWISLTDIRNIPFYSYSSNWENAENKESYLALIVPWKNGNTVKNCYYQIPINSVGTETHPANCLERNTYYQINLEVGMLGSFDPEEPLVLDKASYVITEWVPEAVNVELNNYRYLIVEKNTYILNNENEIYIPFATSHGQALEVESCTQVDLSVVGANDKDVEDYNLEIVNGKIHFIHELENAMENDGFDFTPITLKFTIRHNDADKARWMSEEITIIQYPALYAMAQINTDYSSGGINDGVSGIGGTKGFVWVNGYNNTTGNNNYTFFGSVHGIYDYDDNAEQITNPNMYVITVTSLGSNPRDYVIGDPRVNESDDDFINNYKWYPAKHFINGAVGTSNNHTLQYYYPTDYTSRTENMVAPKFRVASAYSVTWAEGVEDINIAKGRCASYQEDGYPAGRWRMPTKAEYEFIVYQSSMGRIPTLYQSKQNYWCAHGYGKPNDEGSVTMSGEVGTDGNLTLVKGASIRCVYDEWYWEDRLEGRDKVPFTWGDAERK